MPDKIAIFLDALGGYEHYTGRIYMRHQYMHKYEVEITKHFLNKGRRAFDMFEVERCLTLEEAIAHCKKWNCTRILDHNGIHRDLEGNIIKDR